MRFAIVDGAVFRCENWSEYYTIQEKLRKIGLSEAPVYCGSPDSPKHIGIYVPAYSD